MKFSPLLLFIILSINVFAQDQETQWTSINTDRPGEGTDSPFVLPSGALQFENGFFFQYDDGGENREFTTPTGLVRAGLLNNLELRLGYDYLTQDQQFAPLSLGTKIFISDQKKLLPQMAMITTFTLPDDESSTLTPTIRLLAGHEVSDWLSITTNLDADWNNSIRQAVIGYAISFDLSFTGNWGGFTEFYGYIPEFGNSEHLFNAGMVYQIGQDFQLDVSSGFAFTETAPDYFVSFGFAYRLRMF